MADDDEKNPMTPANRERLQKLSKKLGLSPQETLVRALRGYSKKIAEDGRKNSKVHKGDNDV